MRLKMKSLLFLPLVALFLSSVSYTHSLAVISVDLGSEWMKVAFVSVRPVLILRQ